ncbi:MAG: hypothetical protein M3Q48_16590 [Actinomycetota bacterium]|nr:hypothetical protein [Actinomycetota bacterium]
MQRRSAPELATWLVEHDPLEVVPWDDPLVEQHGHPARSAYVETYWLSVIGPASTWAIRRLSAWLDASPAGYQLWLSELGRELGLGAGTGRNSPVIRTLSRLIAFGLAVPMGEALAVRRSLAPLTCRQAARLPEALASQHERERDRSAPQLAGVGAGPLCGSAPAEVAGRTAVRSGKPAAVPPVPPAGEASHAETGAGR